MLSNSKLSSRSDIVNPSFSMSHLNPEQYVILAAEIERLQMLNRNLIHENDSLLKSKGQIAPEHIQELLAKNNKLNVLANELAKENDMYKMQQEVDQVIEEKLKELVSENERLNRELRTRARALGEAVASPRASSMYTIRDPKSNTSMYTTREQKSNNDTDYKSYFDLDLDAMGEKIPGYEEFRDGLFAEGIKSKPPTHPKILENSNAQRSRVLKPNEVDKQSERDNSPLGTFEDPKTINQYLTEEDEEEKQFPSQINGSSNFRKPVGSKVGQNSYSQSVERIPSDPRIQILGNNMYQPTKKIESFGRQSKLPHPIQPTAEPLPKYEESVQSQISPSALLQTFEKVPSDPYIKQPKEQDLTARPFESYNRRLRPQFSGAMEEGSKIRSEVRIQEHLEYSDRSSYSPHFGSRQGDQHLSPESLMQAGEGGVPFKINRRLSKDSIFCKPEEENSSLKDVGQNLEPISTEPKDFGNGSPKNLELKSAFSPQKRQVGRSSFGSMLGPQVLSPRGRQPNGNMEENPLDESQSQFHSYNPLIEEKEAVVEDSEGDAFYTNPSGNLRTGKIEQSVYLNQEQPRGSAQEERRQLTLGIGPQGLPTHGQSNIDNESDLPMPEDCEIVTTPINYEPQRWQKESGTFTGIEEAALKPPQPSLRVSVSSSVFTPSKSARVSLSGPVGPKSVQKKYVQQSAVKPGEDEPSPSIIMSANGLKDGKELIKQGIKLQSIELDLEKNPSNIQVTKENERLRRLVDDRSDELSTLRKEIKDTKQKVFDLEHSNNHLALVSTERDRLKLILEERNKENDEFRRKLRELEHNTTELAESKKTTDQLSTALEALLKEHERVQKELETYKTNPSVSSEEVRLRRELAAENEKLKLDSKALIHERESMLKVLKDKDQLVEEINKNLDKATQGSQQLQDRLGELKSVGGQLGEMREYFNTIAEERDALKDKVLNEERSIELLKVKLREKDTESETLRSQLAGCTADIERLEADNISHKTRVEYLVKKDKEQQKRISKLEEDNKDRDQAHEELSAHFNNLNKDRKNLLEALKAQESGFESLKQHSESMKQDNNRLTEELSALRDKESQLQDATKANELLIEEIQRLTELRKEPGQGQREKQAALAATDDVIDIVSQLKQEKEDLETRIRGLNSDRDTQARLTKGFEVENIRLRTDVEYMLRDINELKERMVSLSKEIERLRLDNSAKDDESTLLRGKLDELRGSTMQVGSLTAENAQLVQVLKERDQVIQHLVQELDRSKQEVGQKTHELNQITVELDNLVSQIGELKSHLDSLSLDGDRLHQILMERDREIEYLKGQNTPKLHELSREMQLITSENERLNGLGKEQTEEITALRDKLGIMAKDSLRLSEQPEEYSLMASEIQELRRHLQSLAKDREELVQVLKERDQELALLRPTTQQMNDTNNLLSREISLLNSGTFKSFTENTDRDKEELLRDNQHLMKTIEVLRADLEAIANERERLITLLRHKDEELFRNRRLKSVPEVEESLREELEELQEKYQALEKMYIHFKEASLDLDQVKDKMDKACEEGEKADPKLRASFDITMTTNARAYGQAGSFVHSV